MSNYTGRYVSFDFNDNNDMNKQDIIAKFITISKIQTIEETKEMFDGFWYNQVAFLPMKNRTYVDWNDVVANVGYKIMQFEWGDSMIKQTNEENKIQFEYPYEIEFSYDPFSIEKTVNEGRTFAQIIGDEPTPEKTQDVLRTGRFALYRKDRDKDMGSKFLVLVGDNGWDFLSQLTEFAKAKDDGIFTIYDCKYQYFNFQFLRIDSVIIEFTEHMKSRGN